jgi:hypothetical protein
MARSGVHRAKPAYPSVAQPDRLRQASAFRDPQGFAPPIWYRRAANVLLRDWVPYTKAGSTYNGWAAQ